MHMEYLEQYWWLLLLSILWTIPWTAYALWKAARLGDKVWFVVMVLVNSLAIVEILYIFVISKRRNLKSS